MSSDYFASFAARTITPEAAPVTERQEVLRGFARGEVPVTVFGLDREVTAHRIIGWLRNIEPTETELIEHAFNGWNAKKIRAYRNGREYVNAAYRGYGELPER